MIKKAIHDLGRRLLTVLQITGVLALVVLIAWIGLLLRLTQGPIRADVLTGTLAKALGEKSGYSLSVGSTELTWRRRFQPMEIQMNDVLIARADKTPVLTVDRVNVQISKRHLLLARVVPRVVEIHAPALRLLRREDGSFALNIDEKSAAPLPAVPSDTPTPPESAAAPADILPVLLQKLGERDIPLFSGLREISITDAAVFYDDRILKKTWLSRRSGISLLRDRHGITLDSDLRLDLAPGHTAALRLKAGHDWKTRRTDVLAVFSGFDPALALKDGGVALGDIAKLGLPLKGSVAVRLDPDLTPAETRFILGSDQGTFAGFGLYDTPVPVKKLYVSGHADLKTRRGEIEKLQIDLGGPRIEATAVSTPENGAVLVNVKAALLDMPIDALKTWWPQGAAPGARAWVTEHLSKGAAQKATLDLSLSVDTGPGHAVALGTVGGRFDFAGVSADYFPPLMPAHGMDGYAVYDDKTFTVALKSGQVGGDMKLKDAKIVITGLDAPADAYQDIDIALSLHGPLKTALKLLDSKPLGYPKMLGLEAEKAGGTGEVNVGFRFPLKNDLLLDEVKITAKAVLKDILLENMISGMPLSGGPLKLDLDNDGMTLDGEARLDAMPLAFKWFRDFRDNVETREKIDARITLDADGLRQFGVPAFLRPAGRMPSTVDYTRHADKTAVLRLKGDIRDLSFGVPMTGYAKPAGTRGEISFLMRLANGEPREISGLDMKAGNAVLKGDMSFDGKGISKASFPNILLNGTKAAVVARRDKAGQYVVQVTGKQLDLSSDAQEKEPPGNDALAAETSDAFDITAHLDRILTGKDKYIDKVTARLQRDAWQRIGRLEMDGIAGGASFGLRYLPAPGGHTLDFQAQNAGAALSALGITDSIKKGALSITARPVPGGGPRDLTGTAVLSKFTVKGAPVLARLLNALSLTGFLDLLNDKGMAFHKARTAFTWTDRGQPAQKKNLRLLRLKNGETSGSSLGLTFEGTLDEWTKTCDLHGTIIPVSDINKMLASIPLVGDIITGGSGSVFAATYTIMGPKADPEVSVNPVSVLAPGLLRKLFFEK